MNRIFLFICLVILLSSAAYGSPPAAKYKNVRALQGLKETRAYFDVTVGDPKLLLIRLQLVEKTHNQIASAGVTPVFIIGVRGKASRYFTNGDGYVLDSDLADKAKIAAQVKKLHTLQINIEQCSIAAGFEDIDVADFLPEVELVANGYVSMIGYHSRGYGLVPMD